ncbi:hypothetical protein [Hymenobacter crusticola]|uniref:Uncharacterized protein n=1 Tax=Hymenobacter crusticola TaxID=1770526 RepID=A0A2C9ZTS0_9BACT|nr:hypothetical protein [Hymenobacter crusticola]OUJ68032.1 hypothetical protein BXP70_28190 [Hymenobacter crusticola]
MLSFAELPFEDQQEYTERLAAIMPAFCAPEDQLLLNLTRYWGCPDAEGTLQELVSVGLLEKSPAGGYRQPLREWVPATAQVEPSSAPLLAVPQAPPASTAPAPTKLTAPASKPATPTSPPSLPPLRLSRPTVLR